MIFRLHIADSLKKGLTKIHQPQNAVFALYDTEGSASCRGF